MIRFFCKTPVVFLPLAFAIGCGSDAPSKGTVQGVVTLDGKPLADVRVQFNPDVEKNALPTMSGGVTDDAGHYTLTCSDGQPGAVVGWHIVRFSEGSKAAPQQASQGRHDPRHTDEAQEEAERAERLKAGSGTVEKQVDRIPAKYQLTGVKEEVKPGKNEINIDLSSK